MHSEGCFEQCARLLGKMTSVLDLRKEHGLGKVKEGASDRGRDLGEGPAAADEVLEGGEAALRGALLDGLRGIHAGEAAVLASHDDHGAAPDGRWQWHPRQVYHLAQPRARCHAHRSLPRTKTCTS